MDEEQASKQIFEDGKKEEGRLLTWSLLAPRMSTTAASTANEQIIVKNHQESAISDNDD